MLLKKAGITNVGICQGVKKDNTSSSTSDQTTSTKDQPVDNGTKDQPTDQDNSTKDQPTNQDSVTAIKDLIKGIGSSIKETVKGQIIPNIKQKNVSDKDMELTEELLQNINQLKDLFGKAETKVQNALQKHYDKIVAFLPNIDKIKSTINKLFSTSSGTSESTTKEDKKETKVNRKSSIQGLKDLLGEVNNMLKKLGA